MPWCDLGTLERLKVFWRKCQVKMSTFLWDGRCPDGVSVSKSLENLTETWWIFEKITRKNENVASQSGMVTFHEYFVAKVFWVRKSWKNKTKINMSLPIGKWLEKRSITPVTFQWRMLWENKIRILVGLSYGFALSGDCKLQNRSDDGMDRIGGRMDPETSTEQN